MKSSTRFIVIASLAPIFTSLSLSAMAENPPKHQEPAKAVQKLDMKKIARSPKLVLKEVRPTRLSMGRSYLPT
jgi:hypothetical protein